MAREEEERIIFCVTNWKLKCWLIRNWGLLGREKSFLQFVTPGPLRNEWRRYLEDVVNIEDNVEEIQREPGEGEDHHDRDEETVSAGLLLYLLLESKDGPRGEKRRD